MLGKVLGWKEQEIAVFLQGKRKGKVIYEISFYFFFYSWLLRTKSKTTYIEKLL